MPPAVEVEPKPELPMAAEPDDALLLAAELRDAVPTLLTLAKRFVRVREEEELLEDELLLDEETAEADDADDVDAVELPELELSPPPVLAAPPPEPPLDEPEDRPPPAPPPRVTDTVIDVESPELLILTDMPPRRPANRGALSETYRSAAVAPVRRRVRSTPPWVAVTVRSVAMGPCGPPVAGCTARFFNHHKPKPHSTATSANKPHRILREGGGTPGTGSGPGCAGRGCLSGAGRPLS